MSINVIGIDPGPATGIVILSWDEPAGRKPDRVHAYQCGHGSAADLLRYLLGRCANWAAGGIEEYRRTGGRSSRTASAADGKITMDLIPVLSGIASGHDLVLSCRPAATVKPWATDSRMEKAGLRAASPRARSAIPAKMIDAYSAGQQALYTAVRDAGVPDPLSRLTARAS
jgi:hypothetical protein